MERRLLSPWGSGFFGLTSKIAPQYRLNFFQQIHQILFFGNGGYDYYSVYNMPIWLRKFTFSEIQKHFDEEKSNIENNNKSSGTKNLVNPDGTVNTPEFMKTTQEYKSKTSYK